MKQAQSSPLSPPQINALQWILRVGFAMDFIGHGTFGLLGKPIFLKYLGVAGISPQTGVHILPWIGASDYLMAILVLVRPMRAFILWGAIWGLWTSLLRPLTGEPWWEVIERGGNYGMPLALFLLAGAPATARDWFTRVRTWSLPAPRVATFAWTLRITTALLLIGHGGISAFMQKGILVKHWASIGVGTDVFGPHTLLPFVGAFEMALGVAALALPLPFILLLAAAWKLGTEALFPISGQPTLYPIFEFIERGGSYTAPLALGLLMHWRRSSRASEAPAAPPIQAERSPA